MPEHREVATSAGLAINFTLSREPRLSQPSPGEPGEGIAISGGGVGGTPTTATGRWV